jgi:hypothetical protein
MEGMSFFENFAKQTSAILKCLSKNKKIDHENDEQRDDAIGFLIDAQQEFNAKNYDKAASFVSCALQKLHKQAKLDYEDDKPRVEAEVIISVSQEKALNARKEFIRLLEELRK